MSASVLLLATELTKSYRASAAAFSRARTVRVVDHLSIRLDRGEVLGLVGESGCGKSTTGRLLLGLERPDSGSVHFNDQPMPKSGSAAWRKLRMRMQMVFQDPLGTLDRRLSIADQIREPLDIHGMGSNHDRSRRVAELLDLVSLSRSYADRRPQELSGGQRQRVVIARALATNPDLLVCDEPISALDLSTQTQIINLFSDLQRRLGTAIIFISHDLRAVRQIAHRVAVMYLGEIVEQGPTEEVLTSPRHPYTQALVSAIPRLSGASHDLIVLKGDLPNPAARPTGCPFHPRCPIARDACRRTKPTMTIVAGSKSSVACLATTQPIFSRRDGR